MQDQYGREINYLRISITDRCNLRCRYCMPEGIKTGSMAEILTYEEIIMVVQCAARLGIRHIKVTGGEPLVRKGCAGLIRRLKEVPGIETVTLTTNGILLAEHLEALKEAGVDGINISMDTRDRELFRMITGGGEIKTVLQAVEKALHIGVKVKINAVSLDWEKMAEEGGFPKPDQSAGWIGMTKLAKEMPVDVRFIEMMPIGLGKSIQSMSHKELLEQMKKRYPDMEESPGVHGCGPARYYHIPGFLGDIGFISAIHGKFCQDCNRVRLTAQGYLKTCLCYEDGIDLKHILRSLDEAACREENIEEAIRNAVWEKACAHCFEKPSDMTEENPMSSIGG